MALKKKRIGLWKLDLTHDPPKTTQSPNHLTQSNFQARLEFHLSSTIPAQFSQPKPKYQLPL